MSDFTPYTDDEIVTFGLIPDGPARFTVLEATRKEGSKGPFINMVLQCESNGIQSRVYFSLHPAMRLTFKHFYQSAGQMALFENGILLGPDDCIGKSGTAILGHEPGNLKQDGVTRWPDKNVVNDFLYPGYDPLRHTKPAPTEPEVPKLNDEDLPF